ncbi:MAG: lactate racemase domain-containing protein [Candidatus Pristimantibacillus sp.]
MSGILRKLVENIPIPKMVKIRQSFDDTILADPLAELTQQLRTSEGTPRISAGQKVAVAVGSRGISRIADLTKTVIDELKRVGAEPFIVPCMGSHGGATAEGQTEVLAHLGIDEVSMGCPVRSSMEVVELDRLPNGLPIYCDRIAATEADAIVVINRIKPHTAFRGPIESGLLKMIAIGLGKQKGAEACHQLGFKYMAENVPAMARVMLSKLPIQFGVAIVENAYDQICRIEVLGPELMEARETELLLEAKSRLPQILFSELDVLVIDYIGKNISGDGADPNITGRYPTPYAHGGPEVNKMVVLDLTPESKGNANGVGTADFTTSRLVGKTDWPGTYANGLTSTVCAPTKQATTLENDRDAIKAGVKTCNILDYTTCRLIRIRDTLHLGTIEISESLLEEARNNPRIEILEGPYEWAFDEEGFLPK